LRLLLAITPLLYYYAIDYAAIIITSHIIDITPHIIAIATLLSHYYYYYIDSHYAIAITP